MAEEIKTIKKVLSPDGEFQFAPDENTLAAIKNNTDKLDKLSLGDINDVPNFVQAAGLKYNETYTDENGKEYEGVIGLENIMYNGSDNTGGESSGSSIDLGDYATKKQVEEYVSSEIDKISETISEVSTMKSDISTINNTLDTVESEVNSVKATAGATNTALSEEIARATSAENTNANAIDILKGTHATDKAALEAADTALGERIDGVKASVDTNAKNIDQIKNSNIPNAVIESKAYTDEQLLNYYKKSETYSSAEIDEQNQINETSILDQTKQYTDTECDAHLELAKAYFDSKIVASTVDIGAGAELASGTLYLVYEE